MFLLSVDDEDRIPGLRTRLVELGDSVLVVGGDGEWNVHAHVDDPGAAVEAGVEAAARTGSASPGSSLTMDWPPTPTTMPTTMPTATPPPMATRNSTRNSAMPTAMVTSGGRADRGRGVCRRGRAGGHLHQGRCRRHLVRAGPRATTGQFIEAIRQQHATGVRGVIVLPNDSDTELAAAPAARAVADEAIEALVVRARTAVQGVAAVAVFEPDAWPTSNLVAMQSAAAGTRHGAVTIANRVGLTSGGPCEPGDALGVVDGDIVIVGSDQLVVARGSGPSAPVERRRLVTLVLGESAPDGLVGAIEAAARAQHRGSR